MLSLLGISGRAVDGLGENRERTRSFRTVEGLLKVHLCEQSCVPEVGIEVQFHCKEVKVLAEDLEWKANLLDKKEGEGAPGLATLAQQMGYGAPSVKRKEGEKEKKPRKEKEKKKENKNEDKETASSESTTLSSSRSGRKREKEKKEKRRKKRRKR